MQVLISRFRHAVLSVGLMLAFGLPLCGAEIVVVPVPWIPEDHDSPTYDSTGTLTGGITFLNLPAEGEIKIYTMTGEPVTTIPFTNPAGNRLSWLGRNDAGESVASGVYLWIVTSDAETLVKKGKLIIIR